VNWQALPLQPEEIQKKFEAIKKHRTQISYSAPFLEAFVRANELFGDFPPIKLDPNVPYSEVIAPGLRPIGDIEVNPESRPRLTLEQELVWLTGDSFNLSLSSARELEEPMLLSIYVFGYRSDTAFAAMPKIMIEIEPFRHEVYERLTPVTDPRISIYHERKKFSVSLPLDILGSPERILTGIRSHVGQLPYDWSAWRILELGAAAPPQPPIPATAASPAHPAGNS